MRVFETERQEWAGSHRERLFDPERYLDLPRQRTLRRYTALVLTVCGLSFGVWALGWKNEPVPYVPPAQETPAAAGTSPGATEDGAPGESSLPAGFAPYDDPEGFRTALPAGWDRANRSSQYGIDVVDFRDPSGPRRLQVFQLAEDSPYASVADAQQDSLKLDGYQEIHLQYASNPTGGEAAEHEYTTDELTGEPATGSGHHVIDHRFAAADGQNYALVAYGSAADGLEDERELLDTARAWFCPPGTECPAPTA
ncbi:hypothetical protein [Streptomyces sp. JW3]|uniref:hypothetical protein n=1 Tax=Streptomyces sp. JW3 TaxID=3456955 RepID=UPI003FA4AC16